MVAVSVGGLDASYLTQVTTIGSLMKILLLGLSLALFLGPPKIPDIGLSITPRIASAPTHVQAKITIKPHDDNRQACLTWESEGESGQHCFPIEGSNFPTTTLYSFPIHDPGDYVTVVYLVRTTKVLQSNTQPLFVN